MTAGTVTPADEVVELLRQLRLPHMRRHAPDVLAIRPKRNAGNQPKPCAPAHRGARRPPSLLDQHQTRGSRVPHRQDLRHLAPTGQLDPGARHNDHWPPSSGSTTTRTSLSAGPHRQKPPPRSPRPRRHPPRLPRPVVLPRSVGSVGASSPRRRHHRSSDPQTDARRLDLHRRHRLRRSAPTPPSPLPRRRRLRTPSIALSSNLHPAGFDELCPRPSPTPPSTDSCTTPTSSSPPATRSAPSHPRQGGRPLRTDPETDGRQWAIDGHHRAGLRPPTGRSCWPSTEIGHRVAAAGARTTGTRRCHRCSASAIRGRSGWTSRCGSRSAPFGNSSMRVGLTI